MAFTSISTVFRSLSDDVVRNLERFTCLMYSSSTEQTEVNMLQKEQRERERNVLFNDALNTFYLRLYGVRHMVKDH